MSGPPSDGSTPQGVEPRVLERIDSIESLEEVIGRLYKERRDGWLPFYLKKLKEFYMMPEARQLYLGLLLQKLSKHGVVLTGELLKVIQDGGLDTWARRKDPRRPDIF